MKFKLLKVLFFFSPFFLILFSNPVYPSTINPFTQTQILTPGMGGLGDLFGNAVALSDTTLVVGAEFTDIGGNSNQGAVYIYTYSVTTGLWTQTQQLVSSDGEAEDLFGDSVAIEGNNLIIGAPGADIGGNNSQGAVYVFTFSNGSWDQSQKLTANDGAAGDDFGSAVALKDLNLIIGAPNADVGIKANQGVVYIFQSSNNTWTQSQKVTSSDGAAGDFFGGVLSLTLSTFAAGVPNAVISGNINQGAVYIFTSTNGNWSQYQKLISSDGQIGDSFGNAVSLSESTVAIGAITADVGGNFSQGAAYIFNLSNGVWTQSQKLIASNGTENNNFGSSVALSGSILAIGADGVDLGEGPGQGAVYIFTYSDGVWSQFQELSASDGSEGSSFGIVTALRGYALLIGANGASEAYLFNSPYSGQPTSCALSSGFSFIPSLFIYLTGFLVLLFLRRIKKI